MKNTFKKLNRKLSPGHLFYPPDWIVLGVNNACNLHCKMCDVGLGNSDTVFGQNLTGTRPMNMPLEMVESIVDQLAETWPTTRLGFAFTEPLIWPGLVDAVGNVAEQTLPEIWNAEIIGDLRRALRSAGGLLPACSRCCSAF